MSRVLVIAGMGMLGHQLVRQLRETHSVGATIRDLEPPAPYPIQGVSLFSGVDLGDDARLERILSENWDVVVNAAGMIKQRPDCADPVQTIAVNSLLPHRLAAACRRHGARFIHFSTDCVFSGAEAGQRGPAGYRETDPPDSRDLYGLSKCLGETSGPGCLTLRTSLVGLELRGHYGLFSWFLRQKEAVVRGFTRAWFTGLTTATAAALVDEIIVRHPDLHGMWHVASDPITKFDLLSLLRDCYQIPVEIRSDESFACDRRLDGSAFRARTGWAAPSWPAMIRSLRDGV